MKKLIAATLFALPLFAFPASAQTHSETITVEVVDVPVLEAMERARKAAAAMIDASTPADYFAVATYTAKNGLQLLTSFTNDHLVAKRAAMALQASSLHDPLAIAISEIERESARFVAIKNSDSAGGSGRDPVEVDPALKHLFYAAQADSAKMPAIRLIQASASTCRRTRKRATTAST